LFLSSSGFEAIFTTMAAAFTELEIPPVYALLFYLSVFIAGMMFLVNILLSLFDALKAHHLEHTEYPFLSILNSVHQGFFPGFWEHDPYPWHWVFQRCFVKIKWGKNAQLKFRSD
jgi:hypothetical protein